MTTRRFFNIAVFILFAFQLQAQYYTQDTFSIKITQIYPPGNDSYFDTYDSNNELKNMERIIFNQYYGGKDANYIMELKNPSGVERKPIQNIRWILVTNGKEENWQTKPVPKTVYSEATLIEIYPCANDGSKNEKGKLAANFDHYFKFFVGGKERPIAQTDFRPFDKCKIAAETYFNKNKPRVDSTFNEVRIYKDSMVVASVNNKDAYESYIRKRDGIVEEKPKAPDNKRDVCRRIVNKHAQKMKKASKAQKPELRKEAFAEIVGCIDVDSTYRTKEVDRNLQLCKEAAEKYMDNDKIQMGSIIEKLDMILILMEKNPKGKPVNFNRLDYFEQTSVSKVKKGIAKLTKEQDNLKKPDKKKKK